MSLLASYMCILDSGINNMLLWLNLGRLNMVCEGHLNLGKNLCETMCLFMLNLYLYRIDCLTSKVRR